MRTTWSEKRVVNVDKDDLGSQVAHGADPTIRFNREGPPELTSCEFSDDSEGAHLSMVSSGVGGKHDAESRAAARFDFHASLQLLDEHRNELHAERLAVCDGQAGGKTLAVIGDAQEDVTASTSKLDAQYAARSPVKRVLHRVSD